MTYARKTLSEIKLIHGNYGNFIKGQKLDKKKEKKYKMPPYQDLAASNEIDGEPLDEKCWPGYEKKGMKTMFGKRYPNCVKKKKTKKEDFSDWRSELEQIEEKKMTKAQIKKRDEIADAISTKEMNKRYGDKNVKYAIATKLAMKEDALDENLRPLVKGFTHFARKLAKKRTKIPYFQLNRPDLTYVPKKSKLAQYAMYHGTSKKSADKIIKSGKFKKSVGDVLNPDGTVFNAKRAFATTDPKKAKFYANKAARRDGSKPEILAVKVRDSNIYNPASIPNEYYVKTKHMKPVGRGVKPIKIKKGEVMQNSFNPLEEKLNSDDKPFVKKLVGKLRKGSKTHAKQADDLEKAMNEGVGNVIKQLAKTVGKKVGSGAKTLGKVADDPVKSLGMGASVGGASAILINQRKEINRRNRRNNPTVEENVNLKFHLGGNKKEISLNYGNTPIAYKRTEKFKSKTSPNAAINKALVKFKKKDDFVKKNIGEDITDEALTIQNWNVDDIKFTEIETVDIIKAKPLKESMSNWREELGEDWQKVNRQDKTDGLSKKAVKAYRRENPGSKLQTAVTKDPKKLKKGSKAAKRRLSFCRRMKGMKKRLTSAKTARDPDSRINKALRRWNC